MVNCDGSNLSIVGNKYCIIPLSVLTASPFNLNLGDSINAYIIATNNYGNSQVSSTGNGAKIVLVPDAPLTLNDNPAVTL